MDWIKFLGAGMLAAGAVPAVLLLDVAIWCTSAAALAGIYVLFVMKRLVRL